VIGMVAWQPVYGATTDEVAAVVGFDPVATLQELEAAGYVRCVAGGWSLTPAGSRLVEGV
jgi:ribosomal protein S19E (S16A)